LEFNDGAVRTGKNVTPVLAENVPMDGAKLLLDRGGGTDASSFVPLKKNPQLYVVIADRPEVLRIAEELAVAYGAAGRVELVPGDMIADPLTTNADFVLMSNILYDWDISERRQLLRRCSESLSTENY